MHRHEGQSNADAVLQDAGRRDFDSGNKDERTMPCSSVTVDGAC